MAAAEHLFNIGGSDYQLHLTVFTDCLQVFLLRESGIASVVQCEYSAGDAFASVDVLLGDRLNPLPRVYGMELGTLLAKKCKSQRVCTSRLASSDPLHVKVA